MLHHRGRVTVLLLSTLQFVPWTHASAGIPDGVAIVVGFHWTQASDEDAMPWPQSPDQLEPRAFEPGLFDLWLYVHTRAPLVGAWTLTAALDYDGTLFQGIDVVDWTSFSDRFRPAPGWPLPGTAFRAEWVRGRCEDPDQFLAAGKDGWWIQPVLRCRVRVTSPDRMVFSDPEPGVPPQLIECADEMHELDGNDSWTRVVPAVFGMEPEEFSGGDPAGVPVLPRTWSAIKVRPR